MLDNRHAVCFGLNYNNTKRLKLRGCINDVNNIKKLLKSNTYNFTDVRVFTDNVQNPHTTFEKMKEELELLAERSKDLNLETVWIHFSGHGTQIYDRNGDEIDNKDECIVPSDYKTGGLLRDDTIKHILRKFNPNTKIICIFDCCHSGTLGDLKYRYLEDGHGVSLESNDTPCASKIILISGCMDKQTSADAYNVRGQCEFSGGMTSCLLLALEESNKENNMCIFDILKKMKANLSQKKFTQIPQLTTSYLLDDNEQLM